MPSALDMVSGIQSARDAGYSDDEIYTHLAQHPDFAKAKEAGYSFDEVYQHTFSKAQEQAKGMQEQALGAGSPVGSMLAQLRGDLKVEQPPEEPGKLTHAQLASATGPDGKLDIHKLAQSMTKDQHKVALEGMGLGGLAQATSPASIAKLGADYSTSPLTRMAAQQVMGTEEVLPSMFFDVPEGVKGALPRPARYRSDVESPLYSTLAGITESVEGTAESMVSGSNIMLAAGMGGAPGLIRRAAQLGFAGQMASHLPELKKNIEEAETPRDKVKAWSDLILTAGMTFEAGKEGFAGESAPRVRSMYTVAPSQEMIDRATTRNQQRMLVEETAKSGETPEPKPQGNPELLDGLHVARKRLIDGFSKQPIEVQKARQAEIDHIDGILLDHDRDAVNESAARTAQSAPPTEQPAPGATAEVQASPPEQLSELEKIKQQLRGSAAPLTAEAVSEAPAPIQPEPPAAEEAKPAPLVGPAMLSEGEIVAKGQIGQKHADLIKGAVAEGNVDAITGEHGFHDENGKALSRTEAADRALATGQIDQAIYDRAMAREGASNKGLHSEDLIEAQQKKGTSEATPTPEPVSPESQAPESPRPADRETPAPGQKLADDLRKLGRVNRDPAEAVARELKYYSDEELSQLQEHLGTADAKPQTLAEAITGKARLKETSRAPSYVDEPAGKEGRGHPTADVAKEAFGEDYVGGPGAMGPREAEALRQEQMTTGLKKATVLTERLSRGQEPLPAAERQSETEAVARAVATSDRDPMAARNLVARILDRGETAITRDEAAQLLVERNRVQEDMRQADATLKNESATDLERTEAQNNLKDLETQIDRLDRAQKEAGSQWGRVGRMYQQMIREDYTLEGIQRKMRTAKGGPLDEAERTQAEELATKMEEASKAQQAAEAEKTALQEQQDLKYYYEQTIKDLQKEVDKAPKVSKPVLDIAQKIVDRWKADADLARQSLRARLGRASAGVDPTIVLDVARIMRAHVGELGLDLAKVSARLLEDFGEEVKPFLKDAWKKTRELIDKESIATDVKDAVKKGIPAKEKTPAEVKAKAKAEAVAGEELSNKLVNDLARAHIKAGVRGEDALMAAVHKDIQEAFPDATERDVRRALVDYGKTKFPSQDVVEKELRETRVLVRLQESIDRLKEGQDALKTGPQRDKATQEIREKQKQLNELLKTRQGPPSPEKLASQEAAKITALENRIADIDKELRTGERPPEGTKVPDSDAVEQLKAERDAMIEKRDEIRRSMEPKPTPEEIAADKAQQAVDRAAAALDRQQRINSGEIKPEPKEKPQPLSELEKELKDRTEELRKAKRDAEKPSPEERYNQTRMKQILKREAELKEQLATGNFEKKAKPEPPKKDAKVAAAEARVTELKREVEKAVEKKKYEQLSPQQKFFKEALSTFRSITAIKILGHGAVGMVTHAGGLIFRPTKATIYWRNFGRQFAMWHNKAYHEQLVYRLKNDPEFETWKKAGASIDPEKTYTDYGMYAQWLGKLGEKGARGFDALKLVRMEMNKADWAKVPEEIKADPKQADAARKLIAEINNKATGATPKTNPMGKGFEEGFYGLAKNPILEAAFFAPRLYASRWGRVLFDPVKTARTLFDPKSSPAEVFAAKLRLRNAAEFTATLVSTLLINQAILSATGSKQNVNLTDPKKSDWLKFKAGGKVIVADGGLLDPVRLMGQVIWKDLLEDRTHQQQYREGSRYKKAVETVGSYLRGKLNPPVGLAADIATGSDFQGRPLPFSKEKPLYKDQTPYEWGEWLLTQGPIPMAGAAKELTADLKEKGFKDREIQVILKGILSFGLGMAGVHAGEDYSMQPKPSGKEATIKLKRR